MDQSICWYFYLYFKSYFAAKCCHFDITYPQRAWCLERKWSGGGEVDIRVFTFSKLFIMFCQQIWNWCDRFAVMALNELQISAVFEDRFLFGRMSCWRETIFYSTEVTRTAVVMEFVERIMQFCHHLKMKAVIDICDLRRRWYSTCPLSFIERDVR